VGLMLIGPTAEDDPTPANFYQRIQLVGADDHATATPQSLLTSYSNYFVGGLGRMGISNYGQVRYQNVYDGIDWLFSTNQGRLQYDFVVKPDADAAQIRLAFPDAVSAELSDDGQLVLTLPNGEKMVQSAPLAYQIRSDGALEAVKSAF